MIAPENKGLVWLAGVWAVILADGLSWYLVQSLKRGRITFPARVARDVSRATDPGLFWMAVIFYLAADVMAITCLVARLCLWIFRNR